MTNSYQTGCVRGCSSVVERSLRMREARGSTPRISTLFYSFFFSFGLFGFLIFIFVSFSPLDICINLPPYCAIQILKELFDFSCFTSGRRRSAQSAERIILQSLVCTCPSRSIGVLVNCNLFQSWRNIF